MREKQTFNSLPQARNQTFKVRIDEMFTDEWNDVCMTFTTDGGTTHTTRIPRGDYMWTDISVGDILSIHIQDYGIRYSKLVIE